MFCCTCFLAPSNSTACLLSVCYSIRYNQCSVRERSQIGNMQRPVVYVCVRETENSFDLHARSMGGTVFKSRYMKNKVIPLRSIKSLHSSALDTFFFLEPQYPSGGLLGFYGAQVTELTIPFLLTGHRSVVGFKSSNYFLRRESNRLLRSSPKR